MFYKKVFFLWLTLQCSQIHSQVNEANLVSDCQGTQTFNVQTILNQTIENERQIIVNRTIILIDNFGTYLIAKATEDPDAPIPTGDQITKYLSGCFFDYQILEGAIEGPMRAINNTIDALAGNGNCITRRRPLRRIVGLVRSILGNLINGVANIVEDIANTLTNSAATFANSVLNGFSVALKPPNIPIQPTSGSTANNTIVLKIQNVINSITNLLSNFVHGIATNVGGQRGMRLPTIRCYNNMLSQLCPQLVFNIMQAIRIIQGKYDDTKSCLTTKIEGLMNMSLQQISLTLM